MKTLLLIAALFFAGSAKAQELFVFTEPASNMAAKSIGARIDNMFTKDDRKKSAIYNLDPEIMVGVSKHIMLHVGAYFSNVSGNFKTDGAALYLKYRFYSIDDVHDHFRMAAFARVAVNNNNIDQYAVTLGRQNAGYEGGVVATKLINKVALSATASVAHAMDNGSNKFLFDDKWRNAANYSLSVGKLMLPKEYTSYKQVNMNFMLELLGQINLYKGYSYLDMAPSVQFIFNSRMRVDLGYRFAMIKKLSRYDEQSGLVRMEYNFYNVFK
jgi:hypothetical protein